MDISGLARRPARQDDPAYAEVDALERSRLSRAARGLPPLPEPSDEDLNLAGSVAVELAAGEVDDPLLDELLDGMRFFERPGWALDEEEWLRAEAAAHPLPWDDDGVENLRLAAELYKRFGGVIAEEYADAG